jgi:Derlin-2/3
MVTVEEWYRSLPVLIKSYWTASVVILILTFIGILPFQWLGFNWHLIYSKFHIWRLVSGFFVFGDLSIYTIMMMGMLVRTGAELEQTSFPGFQGLCELIFLYLFGFIVLDIAAYFIGLSYLGVTFMFYLLHINCRKDPHRPIVVYGFTFENWHITYIYLVMNVLFGGPLIPGLVGILVGHLWVVLHDYVPRIYDKQFLKTPAWISHVIVNYSPKLATMAAGYTGAARAEGGGQAFRAPNPVPPPARAWMRGPGHRLDD